MKYEIRYHEIMSDHILAVPEFSRKEVVEADTQRDLRKYIEKQKDGWGNPFKKSKDKFAGFDYISRAGGIKVKVYKPPKVKKI